MQILICGGGNAAHTLAGLLSAREDLQVSVYLSFEDELRLWQRSWLEGSGVCVHTPEGDVTGRPVRISGDPAEVAPDADIILLATPAFAHEDVLKQLAPHLRPGARIGALPARSCFDLCVADVLGAKASQVMIFGLQTLPWACRIESYGQSVRLLGTKQRVDMAALPASQVEAIASELGGLLQIDLQPVPHFFSLTLAGTGQLIHPGIMYGMFRRWDGKPYIETPLFYQSIDEETTNVLQEMDHEVQRLRRSLEERFRGLDLSAVRPLMDWLLLSYRRDIRDQTSMQTAFITNRSYAGLHAPMLPVEGGLAPDYQARYLSEDVPYGLIAIRGIAELTGVQTPQIDEVIRWAQDQMQTSYLVDGKLSGVDISRSRAPQRYGITAIEELVERARDPAKIRG